MKTEEIENATDQEYQEAMVVMIKSILEIVSGHDILFGMQALMGALANVVLDTAPNAESATDVVRNLAATTCVGIIRAFDMMEDETHLDGEENATHETPFRTQ